MFGRLLFFLFEVGQNGPADSSNCKIPLPPLMFHDWFRFDAEFAPFWAQGARES